MVRANENMPEMTDDELAEWRERLEYESFLDEVAADIADEPRTITVLLHNCQLVTMDAAHVAEFAAHMRRVAAHGLARIADKRATRATAQRHISRLNEYAEIAAEVFAATNDYELP